MRIAVVLDNIRSVHNAASIFRTADAVGVEQIYCCGITPSPLDRFGRVRPDFSKVALGAERSLKWQMIQSTEEAMDILYADGWKIYAIEQSKDAIPYFEAIHHHKIAFILGSEVQGISEHLLDRADEILEIPMRGAKESLNVAVAFGIVAFGLRYPDENIGGA